MDLENALETAGQLRDALAVEVESARQERHLLRALDTAGIFARATARSAFLEEAARLKRELAVSLGRIAQSIGLTELTLEQIRQHAPAEGEALGQLTSEIGALAGALQEIDRLNYQLAGRALACVRGYVEAFRPTPAAYDRRGVRAANMAGAATVSSKG
jgi:hypothetical protein